MFKKRAKLKLSAEVKLTLLLIFLLMGGVMAAYIAGGLNELFTIATRLPGQVISPFVEEPMKMAPLIFLVLLLRIRIKKYWWIACGMFAGLVFALQEASQYIEIGVSPTLRVLPAFGHIAYSGIVSIGSVHIPNIGLKRGSLGTRFKRAFRSISSVNALSFLAVGIALHLGWNLAASLASLRFTIESRFLYIVFSLYDILSFVILFKLAKMSIRR